MTEVVTTFQLNIQQSTTVFPIDYTCGVTMTSNLFDFDEVRFFSRKCLDFRRP